MKEGYIYFENINQLLQGTPEKSIVSRNVVKNDKTDITLFDFAAGQEMTEHKSSHAAIINILSGEAVIILGEDSVKAIAGTFIYMPPEMPHSLTTVSGFSMLLTLIK